MIFKNRIYSLNKSRRILHTSYQWFKKKENTLLPIQASLLETDLRALENAITNKDRAQADTLAKKVELFVKQHTKKSIPLFLGEMIVALVFALVVATIVRQVWFELYEIPTGSMRPSLEEQDRLLVSKTTFGINIPLQTKQFYFDPNLVNRANIMIFSGDGIDLPDTDSTFFGIFPYKKRYIKRCMGKPGDTLYFYGGQIYGLDKDGNDLKIYQESPWLKNLEYIPFINFEGRISVQSNQNGFIDQLLLKQMNEPLGRILFRQEKRAPGSMVGEIQVDQKWVKDNPEAAFRPHDKIETYSDFWGMRNFAMARLLTKEQVKKFTDINPDSLQEGILYLELRHTPNLTNPAPQLLPGYRNQTYFLLTPYVTVIPLQQKHLDSLMENMYTVRFVVSNGKAKKYSVEREPFTSDDPLFSEIPDGTYEFYHGKATKIIWGGIATNLPSTNPIYSKKPQYIQKLYNLGMDFLLRYEPRSTNQTSYPSRYAYFRNGDLYLLGAPIFKKDDPLLKAFTEQEKKREEQSLGSSRPYLAFKDYGPPIKNGTIDKDFLNAFGVKIPDTHYLCLGDNHAISGDSRYFGFVPQQNIQGAPSLVIWPPGPRFGIPPQAPYPWLTLPNLVVWGIALAVLTIYYVIHRYRMSRKLFD